MLAFFRTTFFTVVCCRYWSAPLIIIALLLQTPHWTLAQSDNVGIGTVTPHPNSLLDLSSMNKGLLVPRLNSVQRILINPLPSANGLLVYDTDINTFCYWNSATSDWICLDYLTQGADGATGPQGPQGPTGLTGATGPQGIPGTNGTDGIDGVDGATGPQGIQGPTGVAGAIGPQGNPGTNGINGIDGVDGVTGPQGIQGPTGLTGVTGLQGNPGTNGIDGLDGAVGPQGIQGPTGLTGPTGPSGSGGKGYLLNLGYSNTNLIKNSTYVVGYFWNSQALTLFNDRPSRRAMAPAAGNIKSVQVMSSVAGTLAGVANDNITIKIRNWTQNTEAVLVTTYGLSSANLLGVSRIDNFVLAVPLAVNDGDQIQVRLETPDWITEPTQVNQIFNVYVE